MTLTEIKEFIKIFFSKPHNKITTMLIIMGGFLLPDFDLLDLVKAMSVIGQ